MRGTQHCIQDPLRHASDFKNASFSVQGLLQSRGQNRSANYQVWLCCICTGCRALSACTELLRRGLARSQLFKATHWHAKMKSAVIRYRCMLVLATELQNGAPCSPRSAGGAAPRRPGHSPARRREWGLCRRVLEFERCLVAWRQINRSRCMRLLC